MTSEYLEESMQSPCSPDTDVEAYDDSAGVYRFEDSVMIHGSNGARDAEFKFFCDCWASAVVWYRGLPRPIRCHLEDSWAILINAEGCTDEVLRDTQDFWDDLLMIYAEWLALECDDDDDPHGLP